MGDGETPSFAEAMALQKAKQTAIEQAGTYVESFTKVQNYKLTAEEIQTIAGGVLQVEVLQKTRTLIGDGMRHYVKIKATVTTDKVAELAERIKGKNVAEEYKKLQQDYAKLNQEIDKWKQLIAKTPPGPERENALDQIRERVKDFTAAQKNEAAFYQRLVSGEALFSKALGQLSETRRDQATVEALYQKIISTGYAVGIGEPDTKTSISRPDMVEVQVPVTLRINDEVKSEILNTAASLGGRSIQSTYLLHARESSGRLMFVEEKLMAVEISKETELAQSFQKRIAFSVLALELVKEDGSTLSCFIPHLLTDDEGTDSAGMHDFYPIMPIKRMLFRRPYIPNMTDMIIRMGVPTARDKQLGFDNQQGFIAIYEQPVRFIAATMISIDEAKHIRKIRGKIVDWTANKTIKGMKQCKIYN